MANVKPPGPGPISMILKSSIGNIFLIIFSKIFLSKIKFCPNFFLKELVKEWENQNKLY